MKREKKADEDYKKRVKEQIATDRANQIATRKAQRQTLEQNKTTVEQPSSSTSSRYANIKKNYSKRTCFFLIIITIQFL